MSFECENVTPYCGFVCSTMLANDYPSMLRGGGLFFRTALQANRKTDRKKYNSIFYKLSFHSGKASNNNNFKFSF